MCVIVVLLLATAPSYGHAKDAGVVLERAQISAASSGHFLRVEVTLKNQLSVAVEAVELAIACQGIKPWEKMGRRSVVLEPGLSVSSFLMIEGPTEHPGQCNVRILGYDLKDPTAAILKMLLRTGYSADERAALLAAHRANGANLELMTWAQQIPVEKPDVTDVLEQLIGWFALATHGSSDNAVWPTVQGLERLNQPLQVVLTARERGSRFSSPIAFLLPDGLSTMNEVRQRFKMTIHRPPVFD